MLGRLLIGIVKGLLIGALLGFGLVQLGLGIPAWYVAYPAAALVGIVVGLVAGKPIWAEDARIEAGMKAVVGAILGAGMMFAARRWPTMDVPAALTQLVLAKQPAGAAPTLGTFAITSLAMIAALLGGFYEADNDPAEAQSGKNSPPPAAKRVAGGPRVAATAVDEAPEEDLAEDVDPKLAKK